METLIEEVIEVIQTQVQKMIGIDPEVEIVLKVGLEVEGDLANLYLLPQAKP